MPISAAVGLGLFHIFINGGDRASYQISHEGFAAAAAFNQNDQQGEEGEHSSTLVTDLAPVVHYGTTVMLIIEYIWMRDVITLVL